MAARSRGNGTNFDWLRKSCDISTCDLSPDGNPEKYGRPMKSAIIYFNPLCRMLITFPNSLEPDLDPYCLFFKEFFKKKIILKNKSADIS